MNQHEQHQQEFKYRLDFYWQAISVYAIALILYAVVRGTISGNSITVVFYDPIVFLLTVFIAYSALAFAFNWYSHRSVIIKDGESITFKNRFRERTFAVNEIASIIIGKQSTNKVRGTYRIVKMRIAGRRRVIRLRTGSYLDEDQLILALSRLKRKH